MSTTPETEQIANPSGLPALKHLGELAGAQPVIIVDSREQAPLRFERLESRTGTLFSGDYSVAGLDAEIAIERKSIGDLVTCCMGSNRDRFERELHRLRGFRFKRLLVVGTEHAIRQGQYHSNITPKAVMATLAAFECRYDTPIVFSPTSSLAAQKVEDWAYWYAREICETANNLLRGVRDK